MKKDWIYIWWKNHSDEYPRMAAAARDYLAISAVEIDVERLFNMDGIFLKSGDGVWAVKLWGSFLYLRILFTNSNIMYTRGLRRAPIFIHGYGYIRALENLRIRIRICQILMDIIHRELYSQQRWVGPFDTLVPNKNWAKTYLTHSGTRSPRGARMASVAASQ